LYNMLFAFEQLSSLLKMDRAGSEDFPPSKISFNKLLSDFCVILTSDSM
jgi:hypothetical protein